MYKELAAWYFFHSFFPLVHILKGCNIWQLEGMAIFDLAWLRNACPLDLNSITTSSYLLDLHNNASCFLWFRIPMHHLSQIRPVKPEWLIGVAFLPVPLWVLCRGRVQSLSPPLKLAALANMKNWGELKIYHFATSLGLCTTKKFLCYGETTEWAKRKRRKIPWRKRAEL